MPNYQCLPLLALLPPNYCMADGYKKLGGKASCWRGGYVWFMLWWIGPYFTACPGRGCSAPSFGKCQLLVYGKCIQSTAVLRSGIVDCCAITQTIAVLLVTKWHSGTLEQWYNDTRVDWSNGTSCWESCKKEGFSKKICECNTRFVYWRTSYITRIQYILMTI